MRISDWSSDVCSSDLQTKELQRTLGLTVFLITHDLDTLYAICDRVAVIADKRVIAVGTIDELLATDHPWIQEYFNGPRSRAARSEEHTSELQSLMRISYAVICLQKKNKSTTRHTTHYCTTKQQQHKYKNMNKYSKL